MPRTYQPPLFDHAYDYGELNRNLLYKRQRTQRAAYRARVQASLAGDPVAALTLRDKYQPWVDHYFDTHLPPVPPEPESIPPSNQDLNW